MSKISALLKVPDLFALNKTNWGGIVEIEFSEDIAAYDPPISITTVLLVQSDLIQSGYVGAAPLRKLDGEALYAKGDIVSLELDIKSELMKYDPEELDEFESGKAVLSIAGLVWLKSDFEEFKAEQEVGIEKI